MKYLKETSLRVSKYAYTTVLTIAGSDSGGGAGIQADLKTFSALGCYGASAITAITVQNTLGVSAVFPIPSTIVIEQILAVLDDIKPGAIKIGMVYNAELIHEIANLLREYTHIPIILDPVMRATRGGKLLEMDGVGVLQKELFPLTTLVTPNIDEASILAKMEIKSVEDMKRAASTILKKTNCSSVLVKGSHLKTACVYDIYQNQDGIEQVFAVNAIVTNNTHGTGCTLSAAIAAFIACGETRVSAVIKAKEYVHAAINNGCDVKLGEGHGPLNHFYDPKPFIKNELGQNY